MIKLSSGLLNGEQQVEASLQSPFHSRQMWSHVMWRSTTFDGCPSWCFSSKKRCHVSICATITISQQLPKDYGEMLAIFRNCCKNKITKKNILPDHITNTFDLSPLTSPCAKLWKKTGTAMVSMFTTGNKKSSFTVILHCQANGKRLPPMVILRRKTLSKE